MRLIHVTTLCLLITSCVSLPEKHISKLEGKKLTSAEIDVLFSNVSSEYASINLPGLLFNSLWNDAGRVKSSWRLGHRAGQVSGSWNSGEGLLCSEYDSELPDGTKVECFSLYQVNDEYYAWTPEDRLAGVFRFFTPVISIE